MTCYDASSSRALLFINMAPALELLIFMTVALSTSPELSFFMASALASVHFQTLIFSIVLVGASS